MIGSRCDYEAVVARLTATGCVAADEEASELIDSASDLAALEALVRRRETGEPLAWITSGLQFCGRRIGVDPGVYVPRIQSESLAIKAAKWCVRRPSPPRPAPGADGLDLVRRVVVAAADLLCDHGRLLIEIGGVQDRLLAPDLAAAGFDSTQTWFDEDGDLRGLSAVRRRGRPRA